MSENALPSARKKKSKWIVVLIVVALAASSTAGYFWWQHKINNAALASTFLPPPPIPIFLPLETLTVNLVNPANDPDRVLYIGITLRLPDEDTRKMLNNFMPSVRSRLLMLLTRQDADALANEQGKQRLIEQIKMTLNEPLVAGQPRLVVDDVLFTAFILR